MLYLQTGLEITADCGQKCTAAVVDIGNTPMKKLPFKTFKTFKEAEKYTDKHGIKAIYIDARNLAA